MTHSPLMYGLIKLHRQIDGKLRKSKKDLANVRAVIEIVSPDFDVSALTPIKIYAPNPWFQRGEGFACALEVLREAERPISQTELSRRMLSKRGNKNPSVADLRIIRNAIHVTLLRADGKIVKSTGNRETRRWSAI